MTKPSWQQILRDILLKQAIRDEQSILEACYFCKGAFGSCRCTPWPDEEGFVFNHTLVVQPNISECSRFFVNPVLYYGKPYIEWAKMHVDVVTHDNGLLLKE